MWDLHVVKTVKNGKSKFSFKDVYINHDGTIGAVAKRPFHLEGDTLKELSDSINFLQHTVLSRATVIIDNDINQIYIKHKAGSSGVIE